MTESQPAWNLGSPEYTLHTRISNADFDAVVAKTRLALSEQGFGVLTEIDMQKTLKAKLGVETARYLILGACNPPLAHQAIRAEPAIGALLPCNVVVAEEEQGVFVGAIHPTAMFSVIDRPDVAPVAAEVQQRLERVLAQVEAMDRS